jgi:hypothetical protein
MPWRVPLGLTVRCRFSAHRANLLVLPAHILSYDISQCKPRSNRASQCHADLHRRGCFVENGLMRPAPLLLAKAVTFCELSEAERFDSTNVLPAKRWASSMPQNTGRATNPRAVSPAIGVSSPLPRHADSPRCSRPARPAACSLRSTTQKRMCHSRAACRRGNRNCPQSYGTVFRAVSSRPA